MAGRKIKDAKDARACLSAAKASGLTNAEWARGEGIDGRSLHAWRMNLGADNDNKSRSPKESSGKSRRTKSKSAPPRMVELVPSVKASRPTRPRYAVRCGELTIEFDEHFEDDTLRRLIGVVASC